MKWRDHQIYFGALFWGLGWTLLWIAAATIGIAILKGG